jgi:hypothetical protein
MVARNRKVAALLGAMLVLATGALTVHSAVCGCDDGGCVACVCVAAGAVATLVSGRWGPARSCLRPFRFAATERRAPCLSLPLTGRVLLAPVGPGPPDILRL